ncbi:MAG: SDR family oxidoreductase [Betaproteobacteria bacterium]|nr:SDR family oxidoreductase [Betaproteobacteria bacterium]
MDLGVKGETALVVGASEGIGYESAKGLLEEGARVLICSRSADKLKRAAAALEQATGAKVPWFAADVTRAGDVARLKDWLGQQAPALDILVTAVGGSHRALFEELDDAAWIASYEFNVLGTVRVIRAALDPLKQSKAGGRIVVFGAAGPRMPYPNQVVSNVHKAGLIALVKTLGAEFQPFNIRVNSVSPGRTLTSLWTTRAEKLAKERGVKPEDVIHEFSEEIPMKRFGRPEEIAAMAVFLASHKASYVNCQSILVDGGIARGLV